MFKQTRNEGRRCQRKVSSKGGMSSAAFTARVGGGKTRGEGDVLKGGAEDIGPR